MKFVPYVLIGALSTLLYSCCSSCNQSNPVSFSQRFIHKYGMDLTAEEWAQREGEGKIVTVLDNGVKISESYENGQLHGASTITFPYSEKIEKLKLYDQGTLLKEVLHDKKGIPMQEDAYEFDNRKIVTFWDHNGSPLSVEEYDGDLLMEGTYYNSVGEIESVIQDGNGTRIKRDRSGKLILKDQLEKGGLVRRTTFHPNEQIEAICHYDNYVLQGEQIIFTPSGKLHLKAYWDHGVLHGTKTAYREGNIIVETPYLDGKKQGVERRYNDEGVLTHETAYRDDEKHGPSTTYIGQNSKTQWWFKGKEATDKSFEMLELRRQLTADMERLAPSPR